MSDDGPVLDPQCPPQGPLPVPTRSPEPFPGIRRYHHEEFPVQALCSAKQGRRISVCIPARNEGETIGSVLAPIVRLLTEEGGGVGLVDEVLVVDDGSTDGTVAVARQWGARVMSPPSPSGASPVTLARAPVAAGAGRARPAGRARIVGGEPTGGEPTGGEPTGGGRIDEHPGREARPSPGVAGRAGPGAACRGGAGFGGKGQAMRAALGEATGDLLVFVDADVANFSAHFVTGLLGPLLSETPTSLVKGFYERPLHGAPGGGGRVTELMARPVLDVLFPALADVAQPLAGETAAPRSVLEGCAFADGYAVEMALLLDVAARFGTSTIAQVDLGVRVHRNRSLEELRPQATAILRAALDRSHYVIDR